MSFYYVFLLILVINRILFYREFIFNFITMYMNNKTLICYFVYLEEIY